MDYLWIIRALGGFFILLAISIRMGLLKRLYFRSKGGIYGYLPMGLLFIWYSLFNVLSGGSSQAEIIYYVVFGLLLLITIFLSFLTPAWIKPKWVKWVEKYPQNIRAKMADEVKDNTDWESHITSEESVEKWVRELSGKKLKRR